MPRLRLLTMIEIGAGLSIAGPMFVVGFEFVRSGQFAFGGAMFTLGLVTMFFPSYFLHRFLGRKSLFRRTLERVKPSKLKQKSEPETTADSESGSRPNSPRILKKLRR